MSETSDTDAETATTDGDTPPEQPQPDTAEVDKWKALARKHEAAAKANFQKLAELEAAQSSELEAAKTAADEAAARAAAVEGDLIRYQVAAEKGLPADAVKLLTGSTREEVEAAADTVASLITTSNTARARTPVTALGTSDLAPASTAEQFADAMEQLGL